MTRLAFTIAVGALLVCMPVARATTLRAPAAYQPPVTAKFLLEAERHPLPPEVFQACLDAITHTHTFHSFAGKNAALEAAARADAHKLLEVGRVLPIALDAATLFGQPLLLDGFQYYTAAIASKDAHQVNLEADLINLRPGEEIFVLDPQAARAHGPITEPRTPEGFAWLPMAGGDTVVLVVRSVHNTPPAIAIVSLTHGYINLAKELAKDAAHKANACNNHIACETDPEISFLSSGIGRFTFNRGGGNILCSGALLNVPGTAALEPYFLTANHCVATQQAVITMQVFWDYRAVHCNGNGTPPLGDLPTSMGASMLGSSTSFDHTLASLDSVTVGSYGRAYLGWDLAPPVLGDEVIGIHHPIGEAMRISYGNVTIVSHNHSVGGGAYRDSIRLEWYDGVTEGGSSGSPLLLPAADNSVIGVLTGGPVHLCPENPTSNWDVYGPFRQFFPVVEVFLTVEDEPPPSNPADIDGNGKVDAVDIQLTINAALGHDIAPLDADVNGDGLVNAIDVQFVINAALESG